MHKVEPGLVSVTFRQWTPPQIIELAATAGLAGIEWGGDIHVPAGELAQARLVRQQTAAAGLQVAAYGSYYRVGQPASGPFAKILATAVALGAPVIRVWAGTQGTASAAEADWDAVVRDSVAIAALAATEGIPVAYEFHRNTLTDSYAAAYQLLTQTNHPNLRIYWQPPWHVTVDENVVGLAQIAPWLHHLHLFHWRWADGVRLPLAEGAADWRRYLAQVVHSPAVPPMAGSRFALLEFVAGDDPAQFQHDAATLHQWLAALAAMAPESSRHG
ncbi:MAG: TIM barrel protein [Caldilineaceae bacterium]|nr:TIM barrel protein [Caldilineaceae bacterium]